MSDSRRLVVVVVVVAQAGCPAVYCAVCHGLYSTTEPIDYRRHLSTHPRLSPRHSRRQNGTIIEETCDMTPWRGAGAATRLLPFCACRSFLQADLVCMHAGHYHVMMPTHTYIQYFTCAILPSNRCWARTQGAAGDLLRTMEHLCMTAHKHTLTPTPHIKCETCGSTDSSSNLGSCGAVLSLQEARQQTRLYHRMLYVPVSVQDALASKREGTWKTM